MNITLIRHGLTDWNAVQRLQGQADVPLCHAGRQQVERLAACLGGQARLVVSPLQRAQTTARILLAQGGAIEVDERLMEQHLGAWTGQRLAELDPELVKAWRRGEFVPPGAESVADVQARVGEALAALGESGGSTVVVTHGGVVRAAVSALCGIPRTALAPVAPASVTVVDAGARWVRAYGWQVDVGDLVGGETSHVL